MNRKELIKQYREETQESIMDMIESAVKVKGDEFGEFVVFMSQALRIALGAIEKSETDEERAQYTLLLKGLVETYSHRSNLSISDKKEAREMGYKIVSKVLANAEKLYSKIEKQGGNTDE